ncbi:MAG: AtpZ/AtpI family protein [Candidatus Moranbacteria bacterium]|nr:AtpZ/AtpI family protein [Candidatus Moranbacteria bacterium]
MIEDNKQVKNYWKENGLSLFFKLSGWIVGPILLAVVVGKWLDKKYQTEPWLFLLSVGVAFAISVYGMIKDALAELKRIEAEEKNKKSKD